MSRKDNIIRVGDWVRVVNPVVFDRCGYAVCLETEYARFKEQYPNLTKALSKIAVGDCSAVDGILRALAYASVGKVRKLCGAKREIYAHEDLSLKDRVDFVIDKKRVTTGIYEAASGYDDDYSPPVLMYPETHVIIQLRSGFWIDVKNVYKFGRYRDNSHLW